MQHSDDSPVPKHSEHDLAALQGSWEQIDFEDNGVSNPPDIYGAAGAICRFRDQHFEVRTVEGEILLEGSFELDASTTPKSVTWVDSIGADAGKALLASYQLDGDRFVFIAADEGMDRPQIFRTSPGLTMRTFARVPVASRTRNDCR